MNPIVTQCRYLLSLADPILAGLDDSHCALEPQPGAKTAGWLIGHLTVSGDFARRMCGLPRLCPADWPAQFNPGTEPSHQPTDYPPIATLCEMFRLVYSDLCRVASELDAQPLASMNPFAPAREAFPTVGDFLAYLMTGHLGYHLGQLVAWRAAAGLGRLRRSDALAA
jgi:hypothetical protein